MRRIWAVAVNTVRQALRMRIAVVFTVLLLVLLPVMAGAMSGDGTHKGRCQTFVSYGLSLTSLLLCLLTIVVSVFTVTSDIRHRQIYTVITKPLRRYEFILGKLLGVLVLDAMLLTFFCAGIYGIVRYLPAHYHADPIARQQLDREFFTARASLKPVEPDVTAEARETFEKLRKQDEIPQEVFANELRRQQVMDWVVKQKRLEKRAAGVGERILWEFHNVRPVDPNENLFIRFKYDALPGSESEMWGRWVVGPYSAFAYQTAPEGPVYDQVLRHSSGSFHEILIPAAVVPADGHLAIGFQNVVPNDTAIVFPLDDGVELLYQANTFGANFVRAAAMIFVRLVFLACLGILASTFVSFPVAIMLCLVIFFVATFSTFVIDSFNYLGDSIGGVYSYTVKPVVRMLPEFDKYNPAKYLVPARLIDLSVLAKAAGRMIGIEAPILLALSIWIFSRRELARVTV